MKRASKQINAAHNAVLCAQSGSVADGLRVVQIGGYRVSHDRGAFTLGNEASALANAQNCYDDVIGDFPVMTSTITLVWAG